MFVIATLMLILLLGLGVAGLFMEAANIEDMMPGPAGSRLADDLRVGATIMLFVALYVVYAFHIIIAQGAETLDRLRRLENS
ncbi:MAG: hypothetical protein LBG06_05950 [Deltaproteobacteria bacterium]|nr:hypothetical protein [Deltaproteobacteria bacterium]